MLYQSWIYNVVAMYSTSARNCTDQQTALEGVYPREIRYTRSTSAYPSTRRCLAGLVRATALGVGYSTSRGVGTPYGACVNTVVSARSRAFLIELSCSPVTVLYTDRGT